MYSVNKVDNNIVHWMSIEVSSIHCQFQKVQFAHEKGHAATRADTLGKWKPVERREPGQQGGEVQGGLPGKPLGPGGMNVMINRLL